MALALEVRRRGCDVRLCIPPNFIELADALGFLATPVGIEMRAPRAADGDKPAPVPIPDLVTDQFERIGAAAEGCDIILGANAHQYAARSIAELYGIPYVNALYAPTALPTDENSRAWNVRSLERVNANRKRLGLGPIDDVLRHIVTERPWLAADPTLAPAPSVRGLEIVQTGAWILADSTPLPFDLESFLQSGDPAVYFGFGSMPAPEETSRTLLDAARLVGQRAIVSEGWANLTLNYEASDFRVVSDVNHQALFPRLAAIVHHGGAGTTLAAALAGTPQVIVPMFSDQPFWASRVRELGIGTSVPFGELSVDRLAYALNDACKPAVRERARSIAAEIVVDGASVAAERLVIAA